MATTGQKGDPKKGLRELGFFGLKRRLSRQQSVGVQRAAGNRKARIALHRHTGGDKQPDEVAMSPSPEHLENQVLQPSLGTQIQLIRRQPWGRG